MIVLTRPSDAVTNAEYQAHAQSIGYVVAQLAGLGFSQVEIRRNVATYLAMVQAVTSTVSDPSS